MRIYQENSEVSGTFSLRKELFVLSQLSSYIYAADSTARIKLESVPRIIDTTRTHLKIVVSFFIFLNYSYKNIYFGLDF